MCAPIENLRDTAEALLAGCIPHLHLEHLIFYLDEVGAELHADCDLMLVANLVVDEAPQHARLADSAVTDDYDLEECIELCLRAVRYMIVAELSNLLESVIVVVFPFLYVGIHYVYCKIILFGNYK